MTSSSVAPRLPILRMRTRVHIRRVWRKSFHAADFAFSAVLSVIVIVTIGIVCIISMAWMSFWKKVRGCQ